MAITLDGLGVDLPAEFAPTLLKEAFSASAIGQVAGTEPLTLAGTVIPVYEGGVEVGLVAEAQAKPTSDVSTATHTITPTKVATIVIVSKEAAMANPARMLTNVEADMRNAISRAVDHLVIHGRDPRGNAYTGTNVSIAEAGTTASDVYLGTQPYADIAGALIDAYDAAGVTGDPNAWLFDPRLRGSLTRVVQDVQQGLPDLRGGASVVAGLPAFYNKAVSGRSNHAGGTDLGIRGVVGDFSKVRYGFVERLDIQRSTHATVGGVNMFETNQVALLVEAILGWTVLDQSAFAVLRDGTDPTP